MATGPSTATNPYLIELEPNVTLTSLLTVGDALPGSTTGVFAGIPDGLGAFDNGDGTVSILVNHELGNTLGVVRDHGSVGAFVSAIVLDKNTLEVISGDDLIKTVMQFDSETDTFFAETTAFARFCSSDLALQSAFQFGELGTDARIYLTGEETGPEGRAFATIVTGEETGIAYELASLGNLSFENVTANPFAQSKTVVVGTDDTGGGQMYVYVGDKQDSGNAVEKAGLVGGKLYGISVEGFLNEVNEVPANGNFSMQEIGPDGDASDMTGAEIHAESVTDGVTGFLRPEDAAWDPENPEVLYMATTASFNGNSRLYKLTFTDITQPELGGTIEAVLDGSEGQRMFDNISVGQGKVWLQEDPGGNDYLALVHEYDIATDTLTAQLTFDPAQFTPGLEGFITNNEEASGIIDVTDIFGDEDMRAYLLDAQVHKSTGDPATVEMGQLLLMTVQDVDSYDHRDGVLNGDATNNKLLGRNGEDTIKGGSGNDLLKGGNDNDTIYGGAGDDTINGGRGDDLMYGGTGADVFTFNNYRATGDDVIFDFDLAEDRLVFANGNNLATVEYVDYDNDGMVNDTLLTLEKGGTIILVDTLFI